MDDAPLTSELTYYYNPISRAHVFFPLILPGIFALLLMKGRRLQAMMLYIPALAVICMFVTARSMMESDPEDFIMLSTAGMFAVFSLSTLLSLLPWIVKDGRRLAVLRTFFVLLVAGALMLACSPFDVTASLQVLPQVIFLYAALIIALMITFVTAYFGARKKRSVGLFTTLVFALVPALLIVSSLLIDWVDRFSLVARTLLNGEGHEMPMVFAFASVPILAAYVLIARLVPVFRDALQRLFPPDPKPSAPPPLGQIAMPAEELVA